jgi:hypothetical protein
MIYIEAPNREFPAAKKSIFLAGGITGCSDWQSKVKQQLEDLDIVLLNPRRKDFPIDDPNAAEEQIKWEHDMFLKADIIVFWFCKETLCPIVLFELGTHTMTHKPIIIGMDPDYERRQDVEIQTGLVRPDVDITYSLSDFSKSIKQIVKKESKHLAKIQTEFLKHAQIKEPDLIKKLESIFDHWMR